MTDYADAICRKISEYVNKPLLLANRERNGLFVSPNTSSHILLRFGDDGALKVHEIGPHRCRPLDISLRDIVAKYLDLRSRSAKDLLKYLVTPEMEVERIFNCLRFKYLRAVNLSGFDNPQQYLSHKYNKAFQTLSGLTIYQGNARSRKANDSFWRDAGFTVEAKEQDWHKEQTDMRTIISLMKSIGSTPATGLYAELIAIKPGFHELYLHRDYFDSDCLSNGISPRDAVFRMLRNKAELSSLTIKGLPVEINKNNYISYAPCNVTEGPFVFRKRLSFSYYDEIRGITAKDRLHELHDRFHILDYYNHDLSTRNKLGRFLEQAKPFCKFMT